MLTVTLCGALRVTGAAGSLGARQLGGTKPRHILLALLLRPGQPVSARHLITLLWGQEPRPGATATLVSYVSVLRRKLDALNPGRGSAIATVPGGYVLHAQSVQVDTHRFQALLQQARTPGQAATDAVTAFRAALDAVSGPLLPEEKATSWVEEERAAHQERTTRALTDAADAALTAGQLELAERWARLVLGRDHFNETAWRVLLESLERRGQHADGVRAYDTCRRLFADELGCLPGPGIRATFTRLLAGTTESTQDGVAALVEAVIRLHHQVRSTAPLGVGNGWAHTDLTGPGTVEEASRLLEQLLNTARTRASYRLPVPA